MTDAQSAVPRIDFSMSVDEVLRRYPSTIGVFNEFGIDACCGGARSLRAAAREDGAACCAFLAALELSLADADTSRSGPR